MTVVRATRPPKALCGRPKRDGTGDCTRPAGWGTDHVGAGACKLHGGRTPVKHGLYSVVQRPRVGELIQHFEEQPDPLSTLPELAAARALFADWVERYDEVTEALLAWHASYGPAMRPIAAHAVQALETVLDELEALAGPFDVDDEPEEEEEPQAHGGWLRRTRHEKEADEQRAGLAGAVKEVRKLLVALQTPPDTKPRQMPDLADGHKILETVSKIVHRIQQARSDNAISRPNLFRVLGEMGRVVEAHNDEPDPARRLEYIKRDWLSIRLA